jgi:hypothetical protein
VHHVRANSYGSGIGSCPRIIRVSPSTETTALVCSAAIVVKGVNMTQSQISAPEIRCATMSLNKIADRSMSLPTLMAVIASKSWQWPSRCEPTACASRRRPGRPPTTLGAKLGCHRALPGRSAWGQSVMDNSIIHESRGCARHVESGFSGLIGPMPEYRPSERFNV